MAANDLTTQLVEQVNTARDQGSPLRIVGNNSKAGLAREASGEPLNMAEHRGILDYDPRELVLTARAGTPLAEIEATLAESKQMLAFEPPHFGDATLGGTIACGLSGPRRPFAGSARDFVLGCRLLNGKGEAMRFGGQVMKNVAGYDVSRLVTGSYGTLGVILDVSLKVLPKPAVSATVCRECSDSEAVQSMSALLSQPLPIDAACYSNGQLYLRLSGSEQGVKAALNKVAGEQLTQHTPFWTQLKEQQLSFFTRQGPLWRIVVKPATPPLGIAGEWLYDWGGAQRWLVSSEDAAHIQQQAAEAGGHATLFRGGERSGNVFHPLPTAMLALQQRLKQSFDPAGIINPGRMYAEV
ncbi:glycolate oxidase subunit GlcE [Pseudomonadota bacterium]